MAGFAHDGEQAVRRDEARLQVVLDLPRELAFAGAAAVGDEELPIVAHHRLIRDAPPVRRQRGRIQTPRRPLDLGLRTGRRPDHEAVLGTGACDVRERLPVG